MDLLFVFHLIVLPVEVFCVGAVHDEVAAGFVFTLTTKLKATAYGVYAVAGTWAGDQGTGYCSTGVM